MLFIVLFLMWGCRVECVSAVSLLPVMGQQSSCLERALHGLRLFLLPSCLWLSLGPYCAGCDLGDAIMRLLEPVDAQDGMELNLKFIVKLVVLSLFLFGTTNKVQ